MSDTDQALPLTRARRVWAQLEDQQESTTYSTAVRARSTANITAQLWVTIRTETDSFSPQRPITRTPTKATALRDNSRLRLHHLPGSHLRERLLNQRQTLLETVVITTGSISSSWCNTSTKPLSRTTTINSTPPRRSQAKGLVWINTSKVINPGNRQAFKSCKTCWDSRSKTLPPQGIPSSLAVHFSQVQLELEVLQMQWLQTISSKRSSSSRSRTSRGLTMPMGETTTDRLVETRRASPCCISSNNKPQTKQD